MNGKWYLLAIPLAFVAGLAIPRPQQTIYITEQVPVEVERVVMQTHTEYVMVNHDVPVKEVVYQTTPIDAKAWDNLDYLKQLEKGTTGLRPDQCLYHAEFLQSFLLTQGYPISIALTRDGYYYGVKVSDNPVGHAGFLVHVGSAWYFLDPNDGKTTKLYDSPYNGIAK